MKTKLTLRLDDDLIEKAKRYAEQTGTSVSQLVADYFAALDAETPVSGTALTPRVQRLLGALKGAAVSEEDYRRYLEDKYR